MPIGPARMPLFDHLGELRMRLVRAVVYLAICVIILYFAAPTLGMFLVAPIQQYIGGMIAIDPFEPFGTRFEICLFAGIVAASPMIFWQLLAFFLPALKPKERRWFVPTFIVAIILFILGVIFCYLVILNAAFGWLTDQVTGMGEIEARMSSYIDIVIKFELAFGFAFEIPLIIFYLVVFNVVPYQTLRKNWRIIYIVLMVICALVTPDASPVTMLLMFAALIALYELSLLAARIILSHRIKQQQEKEEMEEAGIFDDEDDEE